MITWADLTPTLLEVAGVGVDPDRFAGRSFREGLDGAGLPGRDEVFASHTFHEVTMHYPMRVVRTRRYKLIHNLASSLPFPSALDLVKSPTWIGATKSEAKMLGIRSVAQFLHRPEFELYDLLSDPDEVKNLADAVGMQTVKAESVEKLKAFQASIKDPWIKKWIYE